MTFTDNIETELLRRKLRQATNQLRQIKCKLMDYTNINQGNKTLNFLTGIPSDTSLGGQGTFFG